MESPLRESDLQGHLLEMIKEQDTTSLSQYLSQEFPLVAQTIQDEYTALNALRSSWSRPARLLLAAVEADAPDIFMILWNSFYAPHYIDQPGPPSNSFEKACGDERVQIPWECLRRSAFKGSIAFASVFRKCEPLALSRAPPFSVHPMGRFGSLIITALRRRRFEFVEYMLAHGVDINHEWPRVNLLRTALSSEQENDETEFMLSWLLQRGVRVQGTGALRLMVQFGLIEPVRILLDYGADVEDADEIRVPLPGRELPEKDSDSALMYAVKRENVAIVRLLLDRGAQADRQNGKGDTPLTLAKTKGLEEILVLLKERATLTGV